MTITRSDRARRPPATTTRRYLRWIVAGAIVSALVVAVTAFSASYQHQYELNIREGQAHWVAGMQPLSVEGLIAATTLTIWFSAVIKRRAREIWPAYLVLLIALGQASLMNLAADHRFHWPWIGPEISIWPAAAFFAAYEMAVWIMRNRPEPVNEGRHEPTAPPTPDLRPIDAPPTPDELARMAGIKQRYQSVNGYDVHLPEVVVPPVVPTPDLIEVPESDDLPDDMEPVHTCNNGAGPKGGKKTRGCPRCDAMLAGLILPKGARRR